MAKAGKFSAIFTTTVTPVEAVLVKTNVKDVEYGRFAADVAFSGGTKRRTVMAFGNQFEAVRDSLVVGQPVELAVQMDGGTVKVIGLPREKLAA